ncbi:hypothetical protein Nepgr_002263 [Nepenthes gracilis]|uniref:Membrane insertase YidC/Oxa/ALB C-terminal domain-containing protein n=1 Tax=Nepenthes gracilis TaxID=150966 RepID=A0AAD3RXN2_NEPGR|nr:hypothetical protein Nepgr_002263 [Nepenthes gracilis]
MILAMTFSFGCVDGLLFGDLEADFDVVCKIPVSLMQSVAVLVVGSDDVAGVITVPLEVDDFGDCLSDAWYFSLHHFEMAYHRSLTTRATLLTRWYLPSFTYIVHHEKRDTSQTQSPYQPQLAADNFIQQQAHIRTISGGNGGSGTLFALCKCGSSFSLPQRVGPLLNRYLSSSIGEGSDSLDYISDVSEVMTEKTMEAVTSQTPVINEVAVAAADSAFPVAALQYLMDAVHSFTGLNWWAAIAITTILIRGATLPLLINQLKATSKLNLIRPHLEEIKQQVQESGMDPIAVAEGQKRMSALFKEHGVGPFTPLKGLLIQGPVFISFFFAISNMVEKVPSFKVGGAFWFTDLTTPDSLYIFPVLASLSFLVTVECNMQEGLEGNPVASTMKNFSRILAVLTIPFTAGFPKALFCYWVTSNLFSLSYGLVLKHPGVRKLLDLPEIQMPSTTASQFNSSSISAVRDYNSIKQDTKPSSDPSKPAERRISSHSILSQRIRSLEKQVKERKKNKKL